MSFFSELAQAILGSVNRKQARGLLMNELSMRDKGQTADVKPVTFYGGMKPGIRKKVEPIINETTAAYKRRHPKESVPDLSSAEGGRHAQEFVENLSDVNSRFYEGLDSNSAESRG